MRIILAGALGLGLLCFTSCSQSPVSSSNKPSGDASTSENEHTDGDAAQRRVVNDRSPNPDANPHNRETEHTAGELHSTHKRSRDHLPKQSKRIAIGDKSPDFAVTIDDKPLKLSELLKDRDLASEGVFVLTFWCSFCHSCRDVEHQVDKLAKQYQGKVGVIAVDASAGETTGGVAEFAAKNKLTFPIALSPDGEAADAFGVRVTTTTVIIDKEGVVRYCGQFSDRTHQFAEDALKAVLAGDEVQVKKTRHKG